MAKLDSTSADFKYDVFLSFRGGTRYAFTDHLYRALIRKGIHTFRDDDKLRIGDEIGPALLEAIEKSRMSIVVLCEDYASSTWCLDELVKIIECHDVKKRHVSAIFYKVEPSHVRYLKKSYEAAMNKHMKRFGEESGKVKAWRSALSRVCDLSGKHCEDKMYESPFIENIVKDALDKLPSVPLQINHVFGFDSRFEEVKPLINIESKDTFCMLGIYGAGGIGKTTFAAYLYNKIRHQFEAGSFLANVREKSNKSIDGLEDLQRTLLSDMGEETQTMMGSTFKGGSEIKRSLGHKRVLLILDDVDKREQLDSLAGGHDWFGPGSKIIITTRDTDVLDNHVLPNVEIKKYKMEELNNCDSLELFCWHAFNMNKPAENFANISSRAISYAKGIPLALSVIGSNLKGGSVEDWEVELDKYMKVPDAKIQGVLEISYNSLSEFEKKIFLDIACFFKGERWEYVKRILEACDFYPVIRVFVSKCLITMDENGCLEMHDLIQDMGREIVRKESPSNPGDRSRLWSHKDILEVLKENSRSRGIEGIMLDPPQPIEVDDWTSSAFENMKNLRILIVRHTKFSAGPTFLPNRLRLLDWERYPSESLPPRFSPDRIVDFNLPRSCLTLLDVLEKPIDHEKFEDLAFINLSNCQSITKIPDVSQAKRLRALTLDRCKRLVRFDESVGFMPNLVYLSAWECTALESFVPTMFLPSLEMLSFNFCSKLEHFPDVVQKMDKPLKIHMIGTAIQQLPHSIGNLTGLHYIDMSFCRGLRDLPRSFFLLPKLVTLKISGCSQLRKSFNRFKESHSTANGCPNLKILYFKNANLVDEDLHTILENFLKLEDLRVSHNKFIYLPDCIKRSFCLKSFDVSYCRNLQEIPELSPSTQKVDARHCQSLTSGASSTLWSKVSKENDRLEVVMPETEIPKWFDFVGNKGIPCFWARRKFPVVALAIVFGKVNENSAAGIVSELFSIYWQPVGLHLFVDGEEICRKDYHYFGVGEDHVLLCDLRVLFNDEEWQGLDGSLGDDWKAIQVQCTSELIVSHWGVYVYKQETNMEDIDFGLSNPNSSRAYMPSVLVLRTPTRRVRHIRETYSLIEPFDEILNVINTVEKSNKPGFLSIFKGEEESSATTYGASLKQQDEGSIRESHWFLKKLKSTAKKIFEAVVSSEPEGENRFIQLGEELWQSKKGYQASALTNGASFKQLGRGFTQEMPTLSEVLKPWKEIMEVVASDPKGKDLDLLTQPGEELRWTVKRDKASDAPYRLSVDRPLKLVEEESDEEIGSFSRGKSKFIRFAEDFSQLGLQHRMRNKNLFYKEKDDDEHSETPYNPPNQDLEETRGVAANNPTPLALRIFEFAPYVLFFGLALGATILCVKYYKK